MKTILKGDFKLRHKYQKASFCIIIWRKSIPSKRNAVAMTQDKKECDRFEESEEIKYGLNEITKEKE